MSDKSYVTMEQHVCIVCAQAYDSGALLLDTRLRDTFEDHTVTGWGMCPEHATLKADDYIALVAIDESKSTVTDNVLLPGNAYRLGPIAHIKTGVFTKVFDVPVPEKGVCFVDQEIINMMEAMETAA